jgi:hypothetical protein
MKKGNGKNNKTRNKRSKNIRSSDELSIEARKNRLSGSICSIVPPTGERCIQKYYDI